MADLHEIQLPDGSKFRTALPPERLAELGAPLPIPSLGERGALALNDGAGGTGNVPATATDATPNYGAGGSGSGNPSGAEGTGHQPGDIAKQAPPPVAPQVSADQAADEKGRAANVGRFGASTTNLDLGDAGGPAPAAPPRPRFVTVRAGDTKGADIRTGYSVQKSGASDLLPEYEDQAADARINAKLAGQELADNRADKLERERGEAAREEIIRQQQAEALAARNAEIQRRKEEAAANLLALDEEQDQIQKLKVNPNQFWDNLGTGGKILAAIGMIAGGINAGMRGGPNQAAEFIYRAIRDDINGQREKIEARRQGFNLKQTTLEKRAAQLGGDLELAAKELEANQLALTAAVGRKHAAETGLANVNPELMMMFAKMDEEAAAMRIDNAAKYSAKVAESFQFIPDKTIQVGGAAPIKPEARERMVRLPGGGYAFVRDSRDKAPVQEKLTANGDVLDLVGQMRAIAENPDLPLSEKRSRWEALRAQAEPIISVANKQGAMSDGEREGMNRILGNPDAVFTGHDTARLKTFDDGLRARLRSTVRDWVNADPDGAVPVVGAPSQGRRYEQ